MSGYIKSLFGYGKHKESDVTDVDATDGNGNILSFYLYSLLKISLLRWKNMYFIETN